jgi:hypothetical protein
MGQESITDKKIFLDVEKRNDYNEIIMKARLFSASRFRSEGTSICHEWQPEV